jgi:hypothetical protein
VEQLPESAVDFVGNLFRGVTGFGKQIAIVAGGKGAGTVGAGPGKTRG